jgi:hypothetical protein
MKNKINENGLVSLEFEIAMQDLKPGTKIKLRNKEIVTFNNYSSRAKSMPIIYNSKGQSYKTSTHNVEEILNEFEDLGIVKISQLKKGDLIGLIGREGIYIVKKVLPTRIEGINPTTPLKTTIINPEGFNIIKIDIDKIKKEII